MGRLILVRHGESEGNRDRRFTSHPHVPLTALGRTQAKRVAEWIGAAARPREVVSSPFRRAEETAEIIAVHLGLSLSLDDDLRERSFGALAGEPYDAVPRDLDPETYWRWAPPGGESLVEVAARAGRTLDRLARGAPEEELVVVSHGGVMQALWFHVTGAWQTVRVAPNAGVVLVAHRAGRYLEARIVDGD